MDAANNVWDAPEGRPIWKKIPLRLGLTIGNPESAQRTHACRRSAADHRTMAANAEPPRFRAELNFRPYSLVND